MHSILNRTFQKNKMKVLLLLSLVTLACSSKLYFNRPVYILEILREKTLASDFKDFKALIPERKLEGLISRYLLGDAQFQAIIRYFGSQEISKAVDLIRGQPEIKGFATWLQQQLQSGHFDSISDDSSSEELFHLLNVNRLPSGGRATLSGWNGFITEFLTIYPRQEIKNLIRDKVAANGVFAEFWNKIVALKPVYERILKLPELQTVIAKLRTLGVDVDQLDQLIREDLGWKIGGAQEVEGNLLGELPENKLEGADAAPIIPVA